MNTYCGFLFASRPVRIESVPRERMGLRARGFGMWIWFAIRSLVIAFGTVVQSITASREPTESLSISDDAESKMSPSFTCGVHQVAPIAFSVAPPYACPEVWVTERLLQPAVPLRPSQPYTLNVRYNAPMPNPNFSEHQTEVVEMDVPEEGLELELLFSSDAIRLTSVPGKEIFGEMPGQPKYTASVSLRLK